MKCFATLPASSLLTFTAFAAEKPTHAPRDIAGGDATGGYLLAYVMPLKKIYLTGKRPGITAHLAAAAAQSFINDSRGWSYHAFADVWAREQVKAGETNAVAKHLIARRKALDRLRNAPQTSTGDNQRPHRRSKDMDRGQYNSACRAFAFTATLTNPE